MISSGPYRGKGSYEKASIGDSVGGGEGEKPRFGVPTLLLHSADDLSPSLEMTDNAPSPAQAHHSALHPTSYTLFLLPLPAGG